MGLFNVLACKGSYKVKSYLDLRAVSKPSPIIMACLSAFYPLEERRYIYYASKSISSIHRIDAVDGVYENIPNHYEKSLYKYKKYDFAENLLYLIRGKIYKCARQSPDIIVFEYVREKV